MTRSFPASRSAGFTLVEATITIAILALAAAVMVPALSGLGIGELRATSARLSGLIKSTYDEASLTGQVYRMSFDFDAKAITVGATEKVLQLEPGTSVLATAATAGDSSAPNALLDGVLAAADELKAKEAETDTSGQSDKKQMAAFAGALLNVGNVAGRSKGMASDDSFTDTGTKLELGDDVHLLDIWTEGMSEPSHEGRTYMYFFPHGYTEDAVIHLENDDAHVFTVRVRALTGSTAIEDGYVEAKK